jgi:dipeptidyl aminopeptidase/acylaminoacyl peptidase
MQTWWKHSIMGILSAALHWLPVAATAQTAKADSFLPAHHYRDVAMAPDGRKAAWVDQQSGVTTIYLADLSVSASSRRALTRGRSSGESICCLSWSPDSQRIAYLATSAGSSQRELFVADIGSGSTHKVTSLKGFLSDPRWSPAGNSIAVLFVENDLSPSGPLGPVSLGTGVMSTDFHEQRIAVIDTSSAGVSQVSPADLFVYDYDWSPDSKSLVATGAHGSGTNNWWSASLYTVEASSATVKEIFKPPLQIAGPRWSPDGKSISFIGGIMSDQDSNGGDLFTIAATGGEARNLTPQMKASAISTAWLPGSREILFTQDIDGLAGVARIDVSTGRITPLWSGQESVSTGGWGIAISPDREGNISALVRSSFEHPPEIFAGAIGSWKQLTHGNEDAKPAWGKVKSLHWTSDSFSVQGWLLFPKSYDPQVKYPMIVSVHGGPAAAAVAGWPASFNSDAVMSGLGYFVFYPNYRGSFGQGEAFTNANVKDYGYGDFRDILTGADAVIHGFPIDAQRIGISGWSYGGYLSMWAVTRTDRFRAAIAGGGISNWQSYFGQCITQQSMIPYFIVPPYQDAEVYLRSSPITFVKNAKTPLLMIAGASDGEVPASQSYEFWRGLQWFGVPTQLVVYPNEGHALTNPEHIRDLSQRKVAWFTKYMQPAGK